MCFTEKDVNLVLVYDTLNSFTDAVLHRQKNAREVKLVGTTVTKPTDQNKEEWCQGIGWLPIDLFSGICTSGLVYVHRVDTGGVP